MVDAKEVDEVGMSYKFSSDLRNDDLKEATMEWLEPHISRINQFCKSIDNRHALFHIPKSHSHESSAEKEYFNLSQKNFDDTQENLTEKFFRYKSYYDKREESFTENDDNKIPTKRARIQPVSVIVSDKSFSSSASNSIASSPVSVMQDDRTKENAEDFYESNNNNNNVKENMTDYQDCDDASIHSNESYQNNEKSGKRNRTEYNYKPAPMVRKSRRNFISAEKKDSIYWERRKRNNEAAKKSRESRREKEIEVNLKCARLEKENSELKYEIITVRDRNTELENTVQLYKNLLIKNNLL